jgi:hypothetical protein
MQFDIRSNVKDVTRWLDDAQKRQLPFATVLAMTKTAQDVKAEELVVMKRVFNNPTPYALNALRVAPAKKKTLIASVEFKDFASKGTPAKRFLNPEVHGGPRSIKSHERQLAPFMAGKRFTSPARGYPRNQYGNIPGSTYSRILSHLKVSSDPTQNITGSKRSKAKRANSQFFAIHGKGVFERRGKKKIRPVLVFTKPPKYTKRFPFYETAGRIVKSIDTNFAIAWQQALATARTPR